MALAMMSPAYPSMLLWGQHRHCKAHWIWCSKLRKFIKFGCGAIDGRFGMSAATSLYLIRVSILVWDCTHRGAIRESFVLAKNCLLL
jgi:hypothetical protein